MTRPKVLFATAALVLASIVVTPTSALAAEDTKFSVDEQGDTFDVRGDIDAVGATYADNGDVVVSLKTVWPVDPATDSNWVNNTGIVWKIDVGGDNVDDYWVVLVNDAGLLAAVTPPGDPATILCRADAYFGSSGFILVGFNHGCIGSPAGFQMRAYHRYSWGTRPEDPSSEDYAPSDGSYCCTVFAPAAPTPPTSPPPASPTSPPPASPTSPSPDPGFGTADTHSGYWMVTDDGQVFNFGAAQNYGSEMATTVKRVDIKPTPTGKGYWILAESGAVHNKGDAKWLGSALNTLQPGEKAAALSATRSGNGYWIFTNRGRVLNFGEAQHFGDMSGTALNGPVLGSVATPSGKGYWMVASDGGIFSFGDAKFFGSMGGRSLNKPVMSMAPDPDGTGYWLVASDGGIFAFDAQFFGSMGGTPLNKPISGMVPGPGGYMMVAHDGGIFAFGNVAFHGSLGANPPLRPVVAVALMA